MATKAQKQNSKLLISELQKVLDLFGWKVDQNLLPYLNSEELGAVSTWLDASPFVDTPLVVWKLISIPNEQWIKPFKNLSDAKAIASLILTSRGEFQFLGTPSERFAEIADSLKLGNNTRFGAVYAETKPELRIWFGSKAAAKLPALAGPAALAAIDALFGVTEAAVRECRVCKCTEQDCRECIEATGEPCHWVEPDLCSRCQSPPKSTTKQNSMTAAGTLSPQIRKAAKRAVAPKVDSKSEILNLKSELSMVRLSSIQPDPENHRKNFDKAALQELADSIKQHGILQPLLLKPLTPGATFYKLIDGERRYRAALLAGLEKVPAQIVDREGLASSLAMFEANIRRADLSPIERAQAIRSLMKTHGLTQDEVGKMIGVKQAQVSNELRLLNLPANLHEHVGNGEGQIAPTTIRPALPFCDVPAVIDALNEMIHDGKPLTPDDVEMSLEGAIQKASRSMRFEPNVSKYSKPRNTVRHFKDCTPADLDALDVRKYDNEERAFNVAKFDELNKEPLKKRTEDFRKATKVSRSSKSEPAKKRQLIKKYKEWSLVGEIERQLKAELGEAIATTKDHEAAARAIWVLAIHGNLSGLCGNDRANSPIARDKYFAKITAFVLDPKKTVAKLRPEVKKTITEARLRTDDVHRIAKLMHVTLGGQWKPTKNMLEMLTEEGLEACRDAIGLETPLTGKPLAARLLATWPPGLIPPFLQDMFGLPKAKPAAAAKKAKAA